jgi:DNA-binding protein
MADIIYVSSKKNIMFYFYMAKNFLENNATVRMRACGAPMSTAAIVAEMLRDGKFVRNFEFATSTLEGRKTQLEVTLHRNAGEWPEEESAGEETGEYNVFVSFAKPLRFWTALVAKYLENNGRCTVTGCGKCISTLMTMYECYSMDRTIHRHPIRTMTKLQTGESFDLQKLKRDHNEDSKPGTENLGRHDSRGGGAKNTGGGQGEGGGVVRPGGRGEREGGDPRGGPPSPQGECPRP